MSEYLLLLNPSSGGGRTMKNRALLEKTLQAYHINYELKITESEFHLRELTRGAGAAYKGIIAVGGDSTLTIVADELFRADSELPLGFIGSGSSDDIVLDLEQNTIEKAVAVIAAGHTENLYEGVVRTGERIVHRFLGQANFGIGVSVNRFVHQHKKSIFLPLRNQTIAGLTGIYRAFRSEKVPVKLQIESREAGSEKKVITEDAFDSVLFTRIRYWAGGRVFAPQAEFTAPVIHAVLMKHSGFLSFIKMALTASERHPPGEPAHVEMLKGTAFTVSASEKLTVQIDGDVFDTGSDTVEVALTDKTIPFFARRK